MQGATLIRNQVVQVREPREKGPVTPTGVMETLHHKQFPIDGIVGLVQYRAHRRHLRVGEHRIPAGFFVLEPMANALAMRFSHRRGDVIGKVARALAQCHYPQAFLLATPVQQGVELRT